MTPPWARPGECHDGGAESRPVGDVGDGPGNSQAAGVHVGEPAHGGWGLWVGVLAGQDSRAERSPGQCAEAQAAGHRDWVQLVSSERVGHAPSVYWPCAVPG